MRVAVVGHVEWVEFAEVDAVPRAGEIVHAREIWSEAAGGGAVAAVQRRAVREDRERRPDPETGRSSK